MSHKKKKKHRKQYTPEKKMDPWDDPMVEPKSDLAKLVCCKGKKACDFLKTYLDLTLSTGEVQLNKQDKTHGMTLLHWAVGSQNVDSSKLLLEMGALPNIKDSNGFAPIFFATGRQANLEIANCLIEHKADVTLTTPDGVTPLHSAAVCGNIEGMKLLLDNGADPRATNCEGTTPLHLCRDDESRKLLHKAARKADKARENENAHCANCLQVSDNLKKCARCHAVMYCGRTCQLRHWKEGGHKEDCRGFLFAYPFENTGYSTALSSVFGSVEPSVSYLHKVEKAEAAKESSRFLINKRFVVKVQIPVIPFTDDGSESGSLMVYNEDKSVVVFIRGRETGYDDIKQKIETEGVFGMKAYFWAELTGDEKGSVKIFPGKFAPYQTW